MSRWRVFFTSEDNLRLGQIENADVSDIADFFSNVYKSVFSIFTYSVYIIVGEYRKHGFIKVGEKKIRDIRDIREIRVFDQAPKVTEVSQYHLFVCVVVFLPLLYASLY